MHKLVACALLAAAPHTLFDGHSLNGWMWSVDPLPPQPSWAAAEGELRTTPGAGTEVYLLTRDSFSDFDLSFEWNAAAGANSGIKYRFQGYWVDRGVVPQPVAGKGRIEPVALEYQITDDEQNPDALGGPLHATASIYEYWPAHKDGPAKAGVWHSGRIVAEGLHIEHWLDGKKVVDVRLDSLELQAAFAKSARRGSSPLLAKHERRISPIALQMHDGVVRFRNVVVRSLAAAGERTARP